MRTVNAALLATVGLLLVMGCQKQDPAAVRASLAVTDFSQAQQPLIVADFAKPVVIGILGKSGVNGTVESWQSADGVGLSLDAGVLVRVAGTGRGLLIADATATRAALRGQGGRAYQKLYKHLTADNQITETVFSCQMSGPVADQITRAGRAAAAQHWQEACSSGSTSMVNDYWTQGGADVVKSRQWFDRIAGHVIIDVPIGAPR